MDGLSLPCIPPEPAVLPLPAEINVVCATQPGTPAKQLFRTYTCECPLVASETRFVAVESNATKAPPAEIEECVLPEFPGMGGVALFTDSSIGNEPFASTRKFTGFDVPPLAPGFARVTATCPADAIAEAGTCTSSGQISPGLQFSTLVGVSVSAPKFTVAACATFTPMMIIVKPDPPAAATVGRKAAICGVF
jgi:hypothetical protein